jgi:tRNA uridine 5-carbamoylmethylation protein Kti12
MLNTVQINRGIPGSGKSTLSMLLRHLCKDKGLTMAVHSTDDLRMVNGVYVFDATKQGYYHNLNYLNFQASLDTGVNLVVVDNTNVIYRDFVKYVEAAKKANYRVVEVFFHPDDIERHVRRNLHSVPIASIQKMHDRLIASKGLQFADKKYEVYPSNYIDNMDAVAKLIVD